MEILYVSAMAISIEKTKFHTTHCTAITQLSMYFVSYQYQEIMKLYNFISQEKHNMRRTKGVWTASS